MPDVENVDAVQYVACSLDVAAANIRFGERFEDFHLLDIVRALVDVRDVGRTIECPGREVGTAAAELRRAESAQRIDEGGVQAILERFDDFDGRGEVLDGGVVLTDVVLYVAEIIESHGRFMRHRPVHPDGHFNDTLRRDVGLIHVLLVEQLQEPGVFLPHGLPCRRAVIGRGFFSNRRLVGNRYRLVQQAPLVDGVGGLLGLRRPCDQQQGNERASSNVAHARVLALRFGFPG